MKSNRQNRGIENVQISGLVRGDGKLLTCKNVLWRNKITG